MAASAAAAGHPAGGRDLSHAVRVERGRLRLRVAAFFAACCLAAAVALPAAARWLPPAWLQSALAGWLALEALFPLWCVVTRAAAQSRGR
jgi:hypothetical protein